MGNQPKVSTLLQNSEKVFHVNDMFDGKLVWDVT